MIQVILFAAIAVIGVQALVIKALVGQIKDIKKEVRRERIATKKFIAILVKSISEQKREAEDYRDAYEECYSEFKVLFKENKLLKEKLVYVEGLHSHVVETLHLLLKQGRIIKTKHFNSIIPYESFGRLSEEDRIELFGA